MPEKQMTFSLPFAQEAVLEVLKDPNRLGECLAFVRKTDGNRWIIKSPMDSVSGTRHLDVETAGGEAWVGFRATGQTLFMTGRIDVEPEGEARTSLRVRVEIEGREGMAVVLNPIIAAQLGAQIKAFLRALEQKLAEAAGETGS